MANFMENGDEAFRSALLSILNIEDHAIFIVNRDSQIVRCTAAAEHILREPLISDADAVQDIRDILSEDACATIQLCIHEKKPSFFQDSIDGVTYAFSASEYQGNCMVLLCPCALSPPEYFQQKDREYVANAYAAIANLTRTEHLAGNKYLAVISRNLRRILRNHSHSSFLFGPQSLSPSSLQVQTNDLSLLLHRIVNYIETKGERKKIKLDVPAKLVFDFDYRLIQIAIINLLSNAIKYGENGIEVSVKISSQFVAITIADDGAGFDKYALSAVNDLPRQSKEKDFYKHNVGFGIALARRIATLHKGSLLITTSSPGGTSVTLTLPAAASELRQRSRYQAHGTSGDAADGGLPVIDVEFSDIY